MYTIQGYFKKKFDNLNPLIIFAPVLYTSLIKKGRGKWPDEALTTCFGLKFNPMSKVPTPSRSSGTDKSDSKLLQ
jgi:hypothetical protein